MSKIRTTTAIAFSTLVVSLVFCYEGFAADLPRTGDPTFTVQEPDKVRARGNGASIVTMAQRSTLEQRNVKIAAAAPEAQPAGSQRISQVDSSTGIESTASQQARAGSAAAGAKIETASGDGKTSSSTLAPVALAPLSARINLDISGIEHPESVRATKSPILLDATKSDKLTLDRVLSIVTGRNLIFLQNQWLGRSAYLSLIGNIGGMVPYSYALNKQAYVIIQSAVMPDPQAVQLYAAQQTAYMVGTQRAALTNNLVPGPPPPTAPTVQNPNPLTVDRENYNVTTVQFANGGSNFFAVLNSYYKNRSVAAAVRTSLQDAMFEATNNYFALCREISLLHVADIVVENSTGIVKINQGLLDSGMGTRLQLLQSQTQLAQDRQQLVNQQAQARAAAINLAVTLNLPLSQYILPQAQPLEKTTLVDPRAPIGTLVALALNKRPEIAQKRNVVNQQYVQTGAALSPIIPSAYYQVQGGTFFPASQAGSTQGQQSSLVFAWNFNNGGVPIVSNFGAGLASARAAKYDLNNTELQIAAQVRQAYIISLAAEKNIEIAKEACSQAQEQLDLAEERLKAGIGINIDVIQAQTTLTIALQNYVRAIYAYNAQQAQLRRAIGGFTVKAVQNNLRYD